MAIQQFSARDFRCLAGVEFEADPRNNLIFGANASGKTSILEALAYLGRARSFRGAPTASLVRHGQQEFVLFGKLAHGRRVRSIGVRNGNNGLEIRVDGDSDVGAAGLAEALPLQIIDPEVHNLVAGGPEGRRRYLDWLAFHVEPGYLDTWRRFRRALKQRNAALRSGASAAVIRGWDAEFCAEAARLHQGRSAALAAVADSLAEAGMALLGGPVSAEYRQGWAADRALEEALASGLERDRQLGSTQHGPQRGDLALNLDERQARRLVSRGQQKLLACALILGATAAARQVLGRPLLLLLDDPAAELDADSQRRLMSRVAALDCQVIATSLTREEAIFADSGAVFHVEHGALSRVS